MQTFTFFKGKPGKKPDSLFYNSDYKTMNRERDF